MTIIVDENTVAMWSVEIQHGSGNFLAHLGRLEGGRLRFDMRFRWYADGVINLADSADRTSWHRLDTKETNEARAIEKFRKVIAHMREASGGGASWELLRGARSSEQFAALLATMPGMHVGPGEGMTDAEVDKYIRQGLRA